jgi:hypothetical protein
MNCVVCGTELNSTTALGREDGLYCDECLTKIVDEGGGKHRISQRDFIDRTGGPLLREKE